MLMVVPERDMPGTSAAAWPAPMASAPPGPERLLGLNAAADALRNEHQHAASHEHHGRHNRRAQRGLHVMGVQQAGGDDRQRADDNEADHARGRIGCGEGPRKRRRHLHELRAEKQDDGQERAQVTGDVECEPQRAGVPTEECTAENQVRGARDRQELGQTLDDPEDDRPQKGHTAKRVSCWDAGRRRAPARCARTPPTACSA